MRIQPDIPRATASDVSLIHPTHHFTFATPETPQSIAFHPDDQTAWIHSETLTVDLWPLTVEYARYPAGILAAICVGVLLWRLVRLVRRPQSKGRVYCRNCNYDITEQLVEGRLASSADRAAGACARCSECGSLCTDARIARGRTLVRRLVGPVSVTAAALLVFAFFLAIQGHWRQRALEWFCWPSVHARELAARHNWIWLRQFEAYGDQVIDFSLRSGQPRRVLHRDCSPTPQLLSVSQNGSALFMVGQHGIIRIDTKSGRVTRRDSDFPGVYCPVDAPIIVHEDAKTGYVFYAGFDPQQSDNVVIKWNPESGHIVDLFAQAVLPRSAGRTTAEQRVFPLGASASGAWLSVEFGGVGSNVRDRAARVLDSNGVQTAWFSLEVTAFHEPDDGVVSGGERGDTIYYLSDYGRRIRGFDLTRLSTLGTLDLPAAAGTCHSLGVSPDGRWLFAACDDIWVRDTLTQRWVARLAAAGTVGMDHLTVSPSGRWLSARGGGASAAATPAGAAATSNLYVWDLSSLNRDPVP